MRFSHLKGCFINSHHGWFQQLEVSTSGLRICLKVMIFKQGSKKGSKGPFLHLQKVFRRLNLSPTA